VTIGPINNSHNHDGRRAPYGRRTSYGRRGADAKLAAARDAIVMVNPDGTAVDCNNAFAQLCGVPAGLIVGRPLERFSPQLALSLNEDSLRMDVSELEINGSEYRFEVRPFDNQPPPGGPARRATDGVVTRVVTLQSVQLTRVA